MLTAGVVIQLTGHIPPNIDGAELPAKNGWPARVSKAGEGLPSPPLSHNSTVAEGRL